MLHPTIPANMLYLGYQLPHNQSETSVCIREGLVLAAGVLSRVLAYDQAHKGPLL